MLSRSLAPERPLPLDFLEVSLKFNGRTAYHSTQVFSKEENGRWPVWTSARSSLASVWRLGLEHLGKGPARICFRLFRISSLVGNFALLVWKLYKIHRKKKRSCDSIKLYLAAFGLRGYRLPSCDENLSFSCSSHFPGLWLFCLLPPPKILTVDLFSLCFGLLLRGIIQNFVSMLLDIRLLPVFCYYE